MGPLAKCPLTTREIKACSLVGDHSPAEIAQRFGVSRSAIYNRIARARKKLPNLLPRTPRAGRVRPFSQIARNPHSPAMSPDSI